ncbi:MAG: enoyl-[acyl-carrier-protein] reductase FabK [Chloroflexota bacterium]|nr:enoyl-[acyl-carrier-protein] reductase FabK [Chloroflexota bacterium]
MLHTSLCDLLGIQYPILQGGMTWVATAELSAAVSEAGGLGIISGNAPPDYVRNQARQTKQLTDKPFGVNIPLFSPYVDEVVEVCIEEGVPVVTTGAGNPGLIMADLKEAGIKVIPVVASVALARRVERMGADAIVAEGMESGGHIGDVATLPLIPQVVDAVDVPVIAAGGIGDGRGLVAALALGAAGVQMGTRFICTAECIAHENYKQALVRGRDRSTITTGHSIGHPMRALRNPMARMFEEMEREGSSEEEIMEFGTGKFRLAAKEGDVKNGSVLAGQICGLIHEVLPAQELISGMIAQAQEVIGQLDSLSS